MCATSSIMESLRTGGNMLVPVSCGQGSQAPHLPHLLATNASSCRYQRAHHSLAKRGYESDEHCASDSEEDDNHTCGESEPAGKGIKRRCSSSGASQDSSGTQEEELASHHQDTVRVLFNRHAYRDLTYCFPLEVYIFVITLGYLSLPQ